MSQIINRFRNGGTIEFDADPEGHISVLITRADGCRYACNLLQCLMHLKKLGKIHGCRVIYDDFVVIYNRTGNTVNPDVLKIIGLLSNHYKADAIEAEVWFNLLYASMVADESTGSDSSKKRLMRLSMHHVLLDDVSAEVAVNFSKGIPWPSLDRLMKAKGF